jgi:hypothetical protein
MGEEFQTPSLSFEKKGLVEPQRKQFPDNTWESHA